MIRAAFALECLLAPVLAMAAGPGMTAAAAAPAFECRLQLPAEVRAGEPVPLQFELINRGTSRLRVLTWNTPLEGWFGRFLRVTLDGREVPYQGPQVKRGAPDVGDYAVLAAGKRARAIVDLTQVYAMTAPGRYEIAFDGWLHDVTTRMPSASRQHPQALDCAPVSTAIVAAK